MLSNGKANERHSAQNSIPLGTVYFEPQCEVSTFLANL